MFGLFSKDKNRKQNAQRSFRVQGKTRASSDSSFSDWRDRVLSFSSDTNEVLRSSLNRIRERCRWFARHNGYAKHYLRLSIDNIVGPAGFKLEVKPVASDGQVDHDQGRIVEQAFSTWAARGECDISGHFSLLDFQRLALTAAIRDGEALIRLHQAGRFGLQLELIDSARLDVDLNNDGNGPLIIMGVEFDKKGRRVAYHIKPATTRSDTGGLYNAIRVDADQIIHVFLADDYTQARGEPWLNVALPDLKKLGSYQESAIHAADAGARNLMILKDNTTNPAVYDNEEGSEMADLDLENGCVYLRDGVDFEKWDPAYPEANYAAFIKSVLQKIASGLGIAYSSLSSDLEAVNYSSIRSGIVQEREIWKSLQTWFTEHLMQPLYEEWLKRALLTGSLPFSSDQYDHLNKATWMARRWSWVDPLKDIQATILEIEHGLRSVSSVIRERGEDPHTVREEILSENQKSEVEKP